MIAAGRGGSSGYAAIVEAQLEQGEQFESSAPAGDPARSQELADDYFRAQLS